MTAVLILAIALVVFGCGGSADNEVSGTQTVGPTTATLTLRLSDSVNRTVDSSVNRIRITGVSSSGDVVFGPVTEERSPEVTWEVPISIKRLVLEFMVSESVVGVFSVAVDLQPGQNLLIEDPDFLDAASPLVSLRVIADSTTFPVEFNPRLAVLGTFEDGSAANLSGSATWSVLEAEVAEIDSTGLLFPKTPGQATVRAEVLDVADELSLTITDARLTRVDVDPASFQIAAATGIFLSATGLYSDGTVLVLTDGVTWSSDLNAIATVDSKGKVIGQVPGVARVTAAYKGRSGVSIATISAATLVALRVSPTDASTILGGTARFQVEGEFSDTTTQDLTQFVTWGSSNAAVATVDDSGVATGVAAGQALIIATDLEETSMASGTVIVTTVPNAPQVATTLVFDGVPSSIGHGVTLEPVVVSVLDQFGQPIPGAAGTVMLSLIAPPQIPVEPVFLGQGSGSGETTGSGSGEPTGSGSGEPTGSGSGEPTGSGSGEPTGSGSGEPTGSGSGEPTGSGSGPPPNPSTGPNGEVGLVGTVSKPLSNGAATFDDLRIYTAGIYVLKAEMTGAQGVSNILTVTFP